MRYANLFSRLVLNLLFVWPFRFIRWCFCKAEEKRYEVDFSDYSDENYEEEELYMNNVLDRAIFFATKAHEGQYRKGTRIPYILHPLEAAAIVGSMTTDTEVIAAAVLHDVVEDTDTTIDEIEEAFGERVAALVEGESENKREDIPAEFTWKLRKRETLEHLVFAPLDVKMITLGDKLSNIRAINRDYKAVGNALWQRFNQKDKNEHFWYYSEIAHCLEDLAPYEAYKEYIRLVEETFAE